MKIALLPKMNSKFYYKLVLYFTVLIAISTFIFQLKLYAAPALDGFTELKQPSGIAFEARQRGDEWHNWLETRDGYGIYENSASGNWEYYRPSTNNTVTNGSTTLYGIASNAIVGEVDPALFSIPKGLQPQRKQSPTGNGYLKKPEFTAASVSVPLLVIGVEYENKSHTYPQEQIQPLLFGASNSISDYYSKVSYSAATITAAIESHGTPNDGFIGWLQLRGNHPDTGQSGWNTTKNQQIAKDAIIAANPYINYALYDTNSNRIIEPTELSIMIIVAGYEASYGANLSPSVWAHSWDMGSVVYPNVDDKYIQQYALFGEIHGDHLSTIGIMCHELGHLMFSLPDLYDTTPISGGDSFGVGYFDLMGFGSWGGALGAYAGSSPTYLSAWSREALSWGTVNTISLSKVIFLPKADGNSNSTFRIDTLNSSEYFLIENRQFTGYDIGFQRQIGTSTTKGGLVIYHIDKAKTEGYARNNNKVNADENDKGVDVEEANEGSYGSSMLDNSIRLSDTNMFFFSKNNISFTDATTPNSKLKNGDSTYISITDISPPCDIMTASVTLPKQIFAARHILSNPEVSTPFAGMAIPTDKVVENEITASHIDMTLQNKESNDVSITLTEESGCPVEGDTIEAYVENSNREFIKVSPRRQITDENGKTAFTIKARNKTGSANITFKNGSLSTQIIVTVVKQTAYETPP